MVDSPNTDLKNALAEADKKTAELKAAQLASDKAAADKTAAERLTADRLPNPFLKSANRKVTDAAETARIADLSRKMTKADVIRLWAGGEHQRAMDLYHALKLGDADQEEVKAACPTWDELATQYGGPVPPGQDGPSPLPKTTR